MQRSSRTSIPRRLALTGLAGAAVLLFGEKKPAPKPNPANQPGAEAGHEALRRSGHNAAAHSAAGGRVATLHDTKRGLEIHHGLNGGWRIIAERPDHTRIVAERGGRGYVQRPYLYSGREYAARSYYYHGVFHRAYYGPYVFRGVPLDVYFPAHYFAPAFYGWVYNPWPVPVTYAWNWAGSPWHGYYGGYFSPYPVYAGATFWLTDYLMADSLQAAYQAPAEANLPVEVLNNPASLTPEVKQLIVDEVRRQVALENAEAMSAGHSEPDPASSSIQRILSDGASHVFVAGQDIDSMDTAGNECAISIGDVLQLTGQTAPATTTVTLTVLASKGGRECARGATVSVSLSDLQQMQNYMRQTIDLGMQELLSKQGQDGLPQAPAAAKATPVPSPIAAHAPPPPSEQEIASAIHQATQEADQAEREAASESQRDVRAVPAVVALGQTPSQVSAALGSPRIILNLGLKKVYVYPELIVTYRDGKVVDASPAPDVKQLVADEVRRQIALENAESQAAGGAQTDEPISGLPRALADGTAHVFVAYRHLDVENTAGTKCAISEGDALELTGQPVAPDATAVKVVVLASKGGKECIKGDVVAVPLADLQGMQNHMQATIDQGLEELRKTQGRGGPASPASVALGQTPDEVVEALGAPKSIVSLGTKKIYVFKDLKVTFKDGKVVDVQ